MDDPQVFAVCVWDVYFASVASMNFHPGAGKGEHIRLSLEECADVADEMWRVRQERLSCLG